MEMIIDCVCAGMTRSGDVYPIGLSNEILQLAVDNTTTMIKDMIQVEKPKKVFLGGTCNGSAWRDNLIKQLKIDYFNPVGDDWNEECYQEELKQRKICDYCLYVITPKMTGMYSIAEVIDDSNKRPKKTIFCLLREDEVKDSYNIRFEPSQYRSLDRVGRMVKDNGAQYFTSLEEVSKFLNA